MEAIHNVTEKDLIRHHLLVLMDRKVVDILRIRRNVRTIVKK